MTHRAPHFSPASARRLPTDLLTWTDSLVPGALALTIPAGQKQRDWPNPVLRAPNLGLRTWVDTPPQITTVAPSPFNQYAWPNPSPRLPNLELRTWTEGIPQSALSLTLPPRAAQFQNPVAARSTSLIPSESGLRILVEEDTLPPKSAELTNPVLAKGRAALFWSATLPPGSLSLTLPPRTAELANPVRDQGRPPSTLFWATLQIQPTAPSPFAQRDWPNPTSKVPSVELRSWFNDLPPGAVALTLPVGQKQQDWPNPLPKQYPVQQWSFSMPIDLIPSQSFPTIRKTLNLKRSHRTAKPKKQSRT